MTLSWIRTPTTDRLAAWARDPLGFSRLDLAGLDAADMPGLARERRIDGHAD